MINKKEISHNTRTLYAFERITAKGIDCQIISERQLEFIYKGYKVIFFPLSGWATGNSITDCRRLNNLLTQLK